MPLDLDTTNAFLAKKGVRLRLEQRGGTLGIRGTWTDANGDRRQRRLPLNVPATPAGLDEAEDLVRDAWKAIRDGLDPALVIVNNKAAAIPTTSTAVRCGDAVDAFKKYWWERRKITPQAEVTWQRIATTLRHLPRQAVLTVALCRDVVLNETEPDTRSRQMTADKLGTLLDHAEIPGANKVRELRGNYQPAERMLPTDQQVIGFLDAVRDLKWGWCTAALATFGTRPNEVPSLVLRDNGTAGSITTKRKGQAPSRRTCFAYPREWVDRYRLHDIEIPGDVRWIDPADYNAGISERWVTSWRWGRQGQAYREAEEEFLPAGFQVYNLRHAWAVRTIKSALNMSLCAKAMGHSQAVHERTYHRWINERDLEDAMADLIA